MMDIGNLHKIGDRIRVCRVEKKLSQENVANDIGISTTAYSKIERGLTNVSIIRLEQITSCLGVPLGRVMHPSDKSQNIPMAGDDGGDFQYMHEMNKQALMIRIENMQADLDRANKSLVEKDEIITLLKDVISKMKKVD